MTRQIDRLLNDYKSSYAQTMTNLENRLVAKADLMMRKLDEFVRSNRESRSGPVENLRQPTDRFRAPRDTKAPPNSRTSFESNPRERSRAAPSSAGWADPISPKAKAPLGGPFSHVSHVRSAPDLIIVSHDTTMYKSKFDLLVSSHEKLITKLSKFTERGESSGRTLKKLKSYKDGSDG